MKKDLIYNLFGKKLREARKSANLTQESLAERVNLTRTSITNIEKGRQHISLHMLYRLATAVGVEPTSLLPEKELIAEAHLIDPKIQKELNKLHLKDNEKAWVLKQVLSSIKQEEGNE